MDKTTRLQYDTACIGYTQHQYPPRQLRFKESTQFRIARHVVLPQKPFLVIKSVHNTTSQDGIGLVFSKILDSLVTKNRSKQVNNTKVGFLLS